MLRICLLIPFAAGLLIGLKGVAQAQNCEYVARCSAMSESALNLAEVMRERGEGITWDEVESLKKLAVYADTLLSLSCKSSKSLRETIYQQQFDRIVEMSREIDFQRILESYQTASLRCNREIGY